ncbi:MAG: hypothetical protein AAFU53_19605 [Cyanobacteria bacterium J06632_3]
MLALCRRRWWWKMAVTQDKLIRLIDQATAENWMTLELTGEGLSDLPPEIGKLTKLKTLSYWLSDYALV